MKRSDLNFIVDAVAFTMFVFLVSTGVIMEFLLPAGSGQSTTLWGLDRHGWGELHFWISVIFLASLALHLFLHWKWILYVLGMRPKGGSGVRLGLGVLGLVALLIVAGAPLLSPIERSDGGRGVNARWDSSSDIHEVLGSMTLSEVLEGTEITFDELMRSLDVAGDVSPEDRIGVVARDHGFSVGDVREIIESDRRADGQRNLGQANQNSLAGSLGQEAQTQSTDPHAHDSESHVAGSEEIRGSMTLGQIAESGVPLRILMEGLGLPDGTPASERIGRLGRQYGFSLTQVRELVDSYH